VAKKLSLLEIVKQVKPTRPKSLIDTLSPKVRAELLEVIAAVAANKLPGSRTAILAAIVDAGIEIGRSQFDLLVSRYRKGDLK
jgi:hypothetical protein